MAKGVKHYFRDGTEHTGATHKDPKGKLMSGARHTKNSKYLYHYSELSKTAQKKARPVKMAKGGSTVNASGNYTQPGMRKGLFNRIKAGGKGGAPGQWSARKAQMLAKQYKAKGGGYKS
jgi:hypothetical protein